MTYELSDGILSISAKYRRMAPLACGASSTNTRRPSCGSARRFENPASRHGLEPASAVVAGTAAAMHRLGHGHAELGDLRLSRSSSMSQAGSANSSSPKKRERKRRARMTVRTVPRKHAAHRLAARRLLGRPLSPTSRPVNRRASVEAMRPTSSLSWRRRVASWSDATSVQAVPDGLCAVTTASADVRWASEASTSSSMPMMAGPALAMRPTSMRPGCCGDDRRIAAVRRPVHMVEQSVHRVRRGRHRARPTCGSGDLPSRSASGASSTSTCRRSSGHRTGWSGRRAPKRRRCPRRSRPGGGRIIADRAGSSASVIFSRPWGRPFDKGGTEQLC